jgi:hypothetical protein
MNNTSWRHHYLPQFYLKGFLNKKCKFKIFDVTRQQFIKSGKDFSTESYFFEKDGNTVLKNGIKDDFIETKFFKKQDDRIAQIFNKIRNYGNDEKFGVTETDMPELQFFVSSLFWRIPTNYDQIKYLIKTKELHELGLLIKSKNDNKTIRNKKLESRIKNDPIFFNSMKNLIPYLTYPRLFDCNTPLTIQTFPDQLPAICSDNPVIMEESILPDIYYDDFIFPLTNKLVLIRGKKINNIMNTIKIDIDLITLKQAKKYVSCTDQKYIEMLNNYYDNNYTSLKELKTSVFHRLIGS